MKILACLAIGAATALGVVTAIAFPALAQQPSEGRLCKTPTTSDFDITDADRRSSPNKPHRDPTTEWHKGFLAAVKHCQKGDALLIEREVLTLAARFCDLDKPFAFKAGPTRPRYARMWEENARFAKSTSCSRLIGRLHQQLTPNLHLTTTGDPRLAIELDDRTHKRGDRQRPDAFVDDVLRQAGIRVFRFRPSKSLDIRQHLGPENATKPGVREVAGA